MSFVVLLLAASLGAIPGKAGAQAVMPAHGLIIERKTSNGMEVILQEDHRLPLVSMSLRYDGGEVAAPPGLEAVAQLTTDLMLHATQHVPRDDYSRLLSHAGATGLGARAWTNGIIFEVTLPSNRVALPLWLWSDQMAYFDATLDDAVIAAKKSELRERQRGTAEGAALSRLDVFANEALYPEGHPYRRKVVAPESVDRVDRAAILAFHDAWINPAHATLTIVGDVTEDKAMTLAERYFGTLPHGSSDRVLPPPFKKLEGETQIDVAANVAAAQVTLRWPTPRQLSVEDGRLDVIARLFKGERTAYLFWKLVDDKKVAVGIRARQHSGAWSSEFEVTINGAPHRKAAEVLRAFDVAVSDIANEGVPTAAIEGAAYEETVGRALAYEGTATRASEFGKFWTLAGNADYASRDFARYRGISPAEIKETMERWLPANRRVVLLVDPDPTASAAGEARARRFTPASKP
jgi:zinc protease